MSELDVHVQKCLRCRWEITLSGRNAYERCLVAWVAHVAALHPNEYLDARKVLEERWAAKWARQWQADNRRHEQWLCAEEGHSEIEYTHDSEPTCTRCGATITIEWLKEHYEARGHQVRFTEDGNSLVIGSVNNRHPRDGGKAPDVVIAPQIKALVDGFEPVLRQVNALVKAMLKGIEDTRR